MIKFLPILTFLGPARGLDMSSISTATKIRSKVPQVVSKYTMTRQDLLCGARNAVFSLSLPLPALAAELIDPSKVQTTQNGIKFVIVNPGSCPATDFKGTLGSCFPASGKYVMIDYTAFLPSGEVFDTTEKRGGRPIVFRLGEKQVVPGLEEVITFMLPGAEVKAFIPSKLAYGSKGVCNINGECLVPPDTPLKYFVKLLKVTSAAG